MRPPANDRSERRGYEDAWNNEVPVSRSLLNILTVLAIGALIVFIATSL